MIFIIMENIISHLDNTLQQHKYFTCFHLLEYIGFRTTHIDAVNILEFPVCQQFQYLTMN